VTLLYRRLDGMPCDEAPDGQWPEQLGTLLAHLHATPPQAIGLETLVAATVREDVRSDCARMMAIVGPRLTAGERARAEQLVEGFLADDRNWQFAPTITHGDIGPEHVLVSPGGELVGVIDWEDLRTGDPAWDFAWLAQDPHATRALAAYGRSNEQLLARARHFWALGPWHEVEHGVATNDPALVESGLAGVRARL
jgi:aminoglycoside phosphotransferase (APT) family kinase protein